MEWQLRNAKNQLSKVVQNAQREGPQVVTVRGERVAVIVPARDYDAMKGSRPTLIDALLAGPAWDEELIEAITQRRDVTF